MKSGKEKKRKGGGWGLVGYGKERKRETGLRGWILDKWVLTGECGGGWLEGRGWGDGGRALDFGRGCWKIARGQPPPCTWGVDAKQRAGIREKVPHPTSPK